jgi:hypothetical protein
MTVDTENGIITGVDCYLGNRRESDIILKHLEKQKRLTGLGIQTLGLDAGYDVGVVHRGLEMLGITGYTGLRHKHNNPMKEGFVYQAGKDCFICGRGQEGGVYDQRR